MNNERYNRIVKGVLWLSLGAAMLPILFAFVLVQPASSRLALASTVDRLSDELSGYQAAAADRFATIIAEGAYPKISEMARESGSRATTFALRMANLRPAHTKTSGIVLTRADGQPDETGACASSEAHPTCGPSVVALRTTERDRAGGAYVRETSDSAGSLRAVSILSPARAALGVESSPLAPLGGFDDDAVLVARLGATSLALGGSLSADGGADARTVTLTGVGQYVAGPEAVDLRRLHGRAAHTFAQGRWRLRPEIDVGAVYLPLDEVRVDAGAGLLDPESDDWILAARPSVAFAGDLGEVSGMRISPRVSAGATWLSQNDFSTAATLLDLETGLTGFAGALPQESLFADLEAGLDLAASNRFRLSMSYGRQFGELYEAHAGRVELNLTF